MRRAPKDRNPSNNCVTNLEWVSVAENIRPLQNRYDIESFRVTPKKYFTDSYICVVETRGAAKRLCCTCCFTCTLGVPKPVGKVQERTLFVHRTRVGCRRTPCHARAIVRVTARESVSRVVSRIISCKPVCDVPPFISRQS